MSYKVNLFFKMRRLSANTRALFLAKQTKNPNKQKAESNS